MSRTLKLLVLRVLRSPVVGVPLWLGAGTLVVSQFVGGTTGFLEFLGASGVLFGVGMGLTRLVWDTNEYVEQVADDLRHEAESDQQRALDELERRLRTENDPRTRETLATMRVLCQRLHSPETWDSSTGVDLLPEIKERALQLYESCVASLERTTQLGAAARKMLTREGRQRVLESRDELIVEVQQGIDQLGRTLDQLYATALERDQSGEEMARIRAELDAGLEVAQRVEQRMSQFEQNLREPESR